MFTLKAKKKAEKKHVHGCIIPTLAVYPFGLDLISTIAVVDSNFYHLIYFQIIMPYLNWIEYKNIILSWKVLVNPEPAHYLSPGSFPPTRCNGDCQCTIWGVLCTDIPGGGRGVWGQTNVLLCEDLLWESQINYGPLWELPMLWYHNSPCSTHCLMMVKTTFMWSTCVWGGQQNNGFIYAVKLCFCAIFRGII